MPTGRTQYLPEPGFHAIHANQMESLLQFVVWLQREQPLAPLEQETFLVQSNGMAQWLKMGLARPLTSEADRGGLGIAASLNCLFPARFLWDIYRQFLAGESIPEELLLDKSRLVWRLFRLLPQCLSEPVFAPLNGFMKGGEPEKRRWQLAEKIADLLDQYQVFRADWLEAWEENRDVVISARGEEKPLGQEQLWQPALWRKLLNDLGGIGLSSRARVHQAFLRKARGLSRAQKPAGLPPRLFVFGVSSLPRQTLEALDALARFTQVILCVNNPCEFYWADIISDKELFKAERKRGKQHSVVGDPADADLHARSNPLLATWGKQGRDYLRLLDEFDDPDEYRARFNTAWQSLDIFIPHGSEDGTRQTLLGRLQNDILSLVPPEEARAEGRICHLQEDDSLRFHAAHSPMREVEVLHDQLLARLQADTDLKARDIVVMVPDINRFAPFIEAVFGRFPPEDPRHIPFSLADEGLRHRIPVLVALETLLGLPQSRFRATEVITLLEVKPFRETFAIDEEELEILKRWISEAGIRWGLDPQHREAFGLSQAFKLNTWREGLRAMMLGYSLGADESWQGTPAFGEVSGLSAAALGKLWRVIEALGQWMALLSEPCHPQEWQSRLIGLISTFLRATSSVEDHRLLERFSLGVDQWVRDTRLAELDEKLDLELFRDLLLNHLDESGLNQQFSGGRVNFATLMPMRAIPFKMVCLLGMNDGDYPRSRPPLDFDLMAKDYRPGDRSRREDDRYLFLEALLSARRSLLISWTGRSQLDDSERPPSVLLAQLFDYLDSLWTLPADEAGIPVPVSRALTTYHPLQPFSRRYFPTERHDGKLSGEDLRSLICEGALFTYAAEWQDTHQARSENQAGTPPAVHDLPERWPAFPIPGASLAKFLADPVSYFFETRLSVRQARENLEALDHEVFALDGLSLWQHQEQLIREAIETADSPESYEQKQSECLSYLCNGGYLGMGVTQEYLAGLTRQNLDDLWAAYYEVRQTFSDIESTPSILAYPTEGEPFVQVSVTGLCCSEDGELARIVIPRKKLLQGERNDKRKRWEAIAGDWIIHLLGQVSERPFHTLILFKDRPDRTVILQSMGKAQAQGILEDLQAAWRKGWCRPLGLEAITALYWLEHAGDQGPDVDSEMLIDRYQKALNDQPWLGRVYPSWDSLLQAGDFVTEARALYQPLLNACQEEGGEA